MADDPQTFEAAVYAAFEEAAELLISKHRDYGPGNIVETGELGLVVRISDKTQRLLNLIFRPLATGHETPEPQHETVTDTFIDLANYAIIALMLRRGWWELPLEE